MAKLTKRGRLTIPKAIRDLWRIKPGSRLTFVPIAPGQVVIRPTAATPKQRD